MPDPTPPAVHMPDEYRVEKHPDCGVHEINKPGVRGYGRGFCTFWGTEAEDNARRVCDLMNAMEGIPSPAAFVKQHADLLAACKGLLSIVVLKNWNIHADINELVKKSRAAILASEVAP